MTEQPNNKREPPSPTIRVGVLGLLAAILLVLPLALAPRADAYIYWTNFTGTGGSIGRSDLDGSGVKKRFIKRGKPADIAVNDRHIYWTRSDGMIGRARLDGTGVDPDFFRAPGARNCNPRFGCEPGYLAVDSSHIYWTTVRGDPSEGTQVGGIGRAKLDGTGVDRNFISGVFGTLAVDHDHIYWTGTEGIGRAKLDGTAVNDSFISGLRSGVRDVAVDHDHIYWSQQPFNEQGRIGRARVDGTGANKSFITGASGAFGVAVDAKHVYWTGSRDDDSPTTTISRAKLDGTDVQRAFIDRIRGDLGLAVDGLPPPGKATAKPTQRQKGKKIVLKVKVKTRERLTAKASGEIKVNPTYKLRPKKVRVAAGKTKTLRLKPTKAKAKKIVAALKRGEKAKARLSVKLTGLAGNTETEKLRVRLKR